MRSEDAQRCSLASCPERIEHWRSKYYLAKILRSRSSLSFSEPCSRRSCRNRWIQVVIEGWDEVDVEIMVGRQRPDIVLLKNGEPIFAIEVFVTHAVDEEKKRDLDEFGIRWIEVNGKRSLYEGTAAWKGISPLTGRYSELSALWVCGACEEAERLRRKQDKEKKEKREREEEKRQAEEDERERLRRQKEEEARKRRIARHEEALKEATRRELERSKERTMSEPSVRRPERAWRRPVIYKIIDVYRDGGRVTRSMYVVSEQVLNGEVIGIALRRNQLTLLHIVGPHSEETKLAIREKFDKSVAEEAGRSGFVDSAMPWLRLTENKPSAFSVVPSFSYPLLAPPYRYLLEVSSGEWVQKHGTEGEPWVSLSVGPHRQLATSLTG